MSVFSIIVLIVLGFVLLLIEFLVLPGITIAGIAGFILIVAGIFLGYYAHGVPTGNIILITSGAGMLIFLVAALKLKTWQRFGLKSEIDGRVGTIDNTVIHQGDTGRTVSKLAPMGKALISDILYEVSSEGGYINAGTEIRVIRIDGNKIFVETKS